jgi:hypothetical protein
MEKNMTLKHLYKPFILSLILILPLTVSTTYADTISDKKSQPQKKADQWLFVITAKEGEIKKNDAGKYTLTLHHSKIERVLAFTDRPNRLVKIIAPQHFKKLWGGNANNSFKKDPPNAVVVFGQKKITLTLQSVSVDKDKTSFVVTSDDDTLRNLEMKNVSAFVDADELELGAGDEDEIEDEVEVM